jgi:hypothetical protein
MSPRDGVIALAAATAVFLLQLPFRTLGVSLLDEGAVLQISAEVAQGGLPYVNGFHYVFPGIFYLTAGAFRLGGTSVETARTLMCLLFGVAAGLAYLIARWSVGRRTALAVVLVFVAYRVWAYPHWQTLNYSPLAMTLLLLATWLLGEGLPTRRLIPVALCGAVCGLAVLAKQDAGATGTAALGVALLLLRRPVMPAALAFGAAWLVVVGGAVALLFAAGAGDAFLQNAIVMPISSALRSEYVGRPPLWPPWRQMAEVRAQPFSFAPPILAELHWRTIVGSRLYRDTAVLDAALRVVFYLPWLAFLVGAAVALVRFRRGRLHTVRARRELLVVLLAAGSLAAFNRPQDWVHCLVLYPPTLLVAVALARPLVNSTITRATGIIVLVAVVGISSVLAMQLRRHFDTPVRSVRGALWVTAPQAHSLEALVDRIAATEPRDAAVLALPYHPLVTFLAARPTLGRFDLLWPGDPAEARDREIIEHLARAPQTVVVYSLSQAPFLPRFPSFAPRLFDYLVEHYAVAEVFGGGAREFGFLLLAPRPAPRGRSLLGGMLAAARVTIEDGTGPRRDGRDLVGEARWPFTDVLRVGTVPNGVVAVSYTIVPEPGERLETHYGIHPDHWIDIPPPITRFAIAVRDQAGEQEVWSDQIDPMVNPGDRPWGIAAVDLSPWARQSIEVILRVRRPPYSPARPELAGWGEPRLVVTASAAP